MNDQEDKTMTEQPYNSDPYAIADYCRVVSPHVLGDYWPGIQLYYPPVKYSPAQGIYEDLDAASKRMKKHALNTSAHTLIFTLKTAVVKKK